MLLTSGCISDLVFMEVVSHFPRLTLCAPVEVPHISYESHFISGTLAPNRVGFNILVQKFVRVQFRAVSRKEKEANFPAMPIRPSFYGGRDMNGMPIYNEECLPRAVANQSPQEG